jgi:beta-glucosidase
VGHIPCFYNHKVSAKGYYKVRGSKDNPGRDYVFDTPDALFRFGHGLSYTTFAYSDLQIVGNTSDAVTVSVTVENTGARRGAEVVQLYVTDEFCRITPFVERLRGFEKIWLEPGQKQTVSFRLGFEDFAFINEKMEQEVEPGTFTIRVGSENSTVEIEK